VQDHHGPSPDRITITGIVTAADLAAGDSLQFKIDVEGHELAALEGMASLLHGRDVAGICEVKHADDDLVDYLCDRFAVSVIWAGVDRRVDAPQLRDVLTQAGPPGGRISVRMSYSGPGRPETDPGRPS
jgi:hypothetical protein